MNVIYRMALLDAFQGLEAQLQVLGHIGRVDRNDGHWVKLRVRSVLLRTHLEVGTREDVLLPLIDSYVADLLALLKQTA